MLDSNIHVVQQILRRLPVAVAGGIIRFVLPVPEQTDEIQLRLARVAGADQGIVIDAGGDVAELVLLAIGEGAQRQRGRQQADACQNDLNPDGEAADRAHFSTLTVIFMRG